MMISHVLYLSVCHCINQAKNMNCMCACMYVYTCVCVCTYVRALRVLLYVQDDIHIEIRLYIEYDGQDTFATRGS
jgi:hypothetical protein